MLFVCLMDRIRDWDQQIQCKMTGKCPIAKVFLNGIERPPLFKDDATKQVKVTCILGAGANLRPCKVHLHFWARLEFF